MIDGLARCAEVAQLVEHVTENHGVGSSILPLGTMFSSVNHQIRIAVSGDSPAEVTARSHGDSGFASQYFRRR